MTRFFRPRPDRPVEGIDPRALAVADRIVPERYRVEDRGFETPCWVWMGYIANTGYGPIHFGPHSARHAILAHRASYEIHRGAVPAGHVLHHKCEQKLCVNPDHLEPLTRAEHIRLHPHPYGCAKTHCKRGHELTPDNTYVEPKSGRHRCRICRGRWNGQQTDA